MRFACSSTITSAATTSMRSAMGRLSQRWNRACSRSFSTTYVPEGQVFGDECLCCRLVGEGGHVFGESLGSLEAGALLPGGVGVVDGGARPIDGNHAFQHLRHDVAQAGLLNGSSPSSGNTPAM